MKQRFVPSIGWSDIAPKPPEEKLNSSVGLLFPVPTNFPNRPV